MGLCTEKDRHSWNTVLPLTRPERPGCQSGPELHQHGPGHALARSGDERHTLRNCGEALSPAVAMALPPRPRQSRAWSVMSGQPDCAVHILMRSAVGQVKTYPAPTATSVSVEKVREELAAAK